ncbi:Ig-like domain-containing protein, partial [Litorilituus lipolyticus]
LSVTSVNDAPSITSTAGTTATEDVQYSYAASVSDSDDSNNGVDLTWSLTNAPMGMTVSSVGVVQWTPTEGILSSGAVTLTVSDGALSDNEIFTISVTSVNDAPSITSTAGTMATEDVQYSYAASVSDSDDSNNGVDLTWSLTNAPTGMTVSSVGVVQWTPTEGILSSGAVTLTVSDGVLSDNEIFTVSVTPVNDAPTAIEQVYSLDENTSVNILLSASDPEGDSVSYTVVALPKHGTLSGSAPNLVYQSQHNYFGSDSFTFKVNDGMVDSNVASVNLTINKVNFAPVALDDDVTVIENSSQNMVTVLANDSDIDGDELLVIQASANTGTVVIREDNRLVYTPLIDSLATDIIHYQISDGQGGQDQARVFVTIVAPENLPPVAVDDEFTLTSSEEVSLDVLINDYDPEGDNIELVSAYSDFGQVSINNDKLIFQPQQGISGELAISYTIKDPVGNTAKAIVIVNIESDEGPIFLPPNHMCDESTINAIALYTQVELDVVSAVDRHGNKIPVSLINDHLLLPPGANDIYWQATDSEGNTAIKVQRVCVSPQVSIAADQDAMLGERLEVVFYLNGSAPSYPMTIPFDVITSNVEHTLIAREVVIESGTQGSITFDILENENITDDGSIEIHLHDVLNLGKKYQHTIYIKHENIAPTVNLSVSQQQEQRVQVSQVDGEVTVSAELYDANKQDVLDYHWTTIHQDLVNVSELDKQFIFDPSNLEMGIYSLTFNVSDNKEPVGVDSETIHIEVVAELADLTSKDSNKNGIPDNVEGHQDSNGNGIADYLDRDGNCNVLLQQSEQNFSHLIETQAGICLRRGQFSLGDSSGGAQIISNENTPVDPNAMNSGGIFDYVAYNIEKAGSSIAVVIPQEKAIPDNALYRKYSTVNGWNTFVENERNSLWSTQGEPGYCPPPSPSPKGIVWSSGLTAGHWCILQIIEDGGENDDDFIANGIVVDPGGIAVMLSSNHAPVANDDMVEMHLNETLEVNELIIDVLANDIDQDGDLIEVVFASASIGQVTIIDGLLHYQAVENYGGNITLQYAISDLQGGVDSATVYIETILNKAPIVTNESSQINQGQSVTINLLANDSDPEAMPLSLIHLDNDSVSYSADGQATFTPNANFHGDITINYTVSDEVGNTRVGQWHIQVVEVVVVEGTTRGGGALFWLILTLMLSIIARSVIYKTVRSSRSV